MGADEKHAATYHGGEYTPTTNDIREVWGGFSEYGGLVIRPSGTATFLDDRYAEFDRWLETVRAEAKAEAWHEGWDAGWVDAWNNAESLKTKVTISENPYK